MSIIEYQGSALHIDRIGTGYASHRYKVKLLKGWWPDEEDLLTLCDGEWPPNKCHFGGVVEKCGDTAIATVYID